MVPRIREGGVGPSPKAPPVLRWNNAPLDENFALHFLGDLLYQLACVLAAARAARGAGRAEALQAAAPLALLTSASVKIDGDEDSGWQCDADEARFPSARFYNDFGIAQSIQVPDEK